MHEKYHTILTSSTPFVCSPAPNWGLIHNTTDWGGGLFQAPHPISETTGPIFKIQTAFDSHCKSVERNLITLTSRSSMTSQVRSKSNYSRLLHIHTWGSCLQHELKLALFCSTYPKMDGEEYSACTDPIIGMFEVKARS